jgi:hypothetical protein
VIEPKRYIPGSLSRLVPGSLFTPSIRWDGYEWTRHGRHDASVPKAVIATDTWGLLISYVDNLVYVVFPSSSPGLGWTIRGNIIETIDDE